MEVHLHIKRRLSEVHGYERCNTGNLFVFAETIWSLKHFSHLSERCVKNSA